MDLIWLVLATLIIYFIQVLLYKRYVFSNFEYTRGFNVTTCFQGEQIELLEVITNRKIIPMPWVRAESKIPDSIIFGAKPETSGDHDQWFFHTSVFSLMPYQRVLRSYNILCNRRGIYDLGSVSISSGDLFDNMTSTLQKQNNAVITVYPRLIDPQAIDLPTTRWQGDLTVMRWIIDDPFLLLGIREYQPGDTMRDVHWKATARTGNLQVKTHDKTSDPKLMVIMNIEPRENLWSEIVKDDHNLLEYGFSLAASLCVMALSHGLEAGFACNCASHGQPANDGIILPPARAQGQTENVLETIARAQIRRTRSFTGFLESLEPQLHNTDVLILTAHRNDELETIAQRLRQKGNQVLFHRLEEPAESFDVHGKEDIA